MSPPDDREGVRCAVEVGRHPGPLWISVTGHLVVCEEHKRQYQTAYDDYSHLEPWSLLENVAAGLPGPQNESEAT